MEFMEIVGFRHQVRNPSRPSPPIFHTASEKNLGVGKATRLIVYSSLVQEGVVCICYLFPVYLVSGFSSHELQKI